LGAGDADLEGSYGEIASLPSSGGRAGRTGSSTHLKVDDDLYAHSSPNDVAHGNGKPASTTPKAATIFAVGDRVDVKGKGAGTVRFAGPHHVEGTPRLGVELDDPTGKNNGTVTGHRYFLCAPGHGALVKPHKATASAAGTFGVDVKGGTDNAAGTMSNMSLGLGDYSGFGDPEQEAGYFDVAPAIDV